jgi:hypothetical protein
MKTTKPGTLRSSKIAGKICPPFGGSCEQLNYRRMVVIKNELLGVSLDLEY